MRPQAPTDTHQRFSPIAFLFAGPKMELQLFRRRPMSLALYKIGFVIFLGASSAA